MEDRWYGGVSMELRGPPALRAGGGSSRRERKGSQRDKK
jgi:hypothetical protein